MSRFVVSREFTFCAAHRVEGHPKCGRLHGHNYKVTVHVSAQALDQMGMVIDFGTLDVVVKPLIDRMDHRYLISAANVEAGDLYADIALKKGEGFLMSVPQTTAECMGEQIHSWVCDALSCAPRDVIVEVQETPRNVAIFTMED